MIEELPTWLQILLGPLGTLALALYALIGVQKGWWYSGKQYDACRQELEEWKTMALGLLKTADKAVELMKNGNKP